jgi:hypothetical protein
MDHGFQPANVKLQLCGTLPSASRFLGKAFKNQNMPMSTAPSEDGTIPSGNEIVPTCPGHRGSINPMFRHPEPIHHRLNMLKS